MTYLLLEFQFKVAVQINILVVAPVYVNLIGLECVKLDKSKPEDVEGNDEVRSGGVQAENVPPEATVIFSYPKGSELEDCQYAVP